MPVFTTHLLLANDDVDADVHVDEHANASANAVTIPIHYLTQYSGEVRQLLLDAKVGSCPFALEDVLEIATRETRALEMNYDFLVPAPSSLWSRLRGRYDVAYAIARAFSEVYGVKMRSAPIRQHWRMRKRAMQEKVPAFAEATAGKPCAGLPAEALAKAGHLLLIDDIATTGWTLTNLALPFLNQGFRVDCFVFALAGSYLQE